MEIEMFDVWKWICDSQDMYMYACVHACMRACVHACMRACVHACMRACVHACMRACVHACMRACVHACMCFHVSRPPSPYGVEVVVLK